MPVPNPGGGGGRASTGGGGGGGGCLGSGCGLWWCIDDAAVTDMVGAVAFVAIAAAAIAAAVAVKGVGAIEKSCRNAEGAKRVETKTRRENAEEDTRKKHVPGVERLRGKRRSRCELVRKLRYRRRVSKYSVVPKRESIRHL